MRPAGGIPGAGRGGRTEAGLRLRLLAGAGSQMVWFRFFMHHYLKRIFPRWFCFVDARWIV